MKQRNARAANTHDLLAVRSLKGCMSKAPRALVAKTGKRSEIRLQKLAVLTAARPPAARLGCCLHRCRDLGVKAKKGGSKQSGL